MKRLSRRTDALASVSWQRARGVRVAGMMGMLCVGVSCASAPTTPPPDPLRTYNPDAATLGGVRDFGPIYWQMGLISSGPPISFVGGAAFFATSSPDTTLTVVSISIPNRGLTFERDGFNYRASYGVELTLRRNGSEVRKNNEGEPVVVSSFRETNRTDESVLFRQVLRTPPGQYYIRYTVRDSLGSREASRDALIRIPRFNPTSIAPPVVIYEGAPRISLDSVPQYVPKPRASSIFGIDQQATVYLEAYGTTITTPVLLSLRNDKNAVLWEDTAWLAQRKGFAAGVIKVPLWQADAGILTLSATRAAARDTFKTPIFLGFGSDLPVVSFDEMVSYLRFFASPDQIRALKTAPLDERGIVWANFLRSTDPTPETPQNEAILDYFKRIQEANVQFRSDAAQGWLSDRGSVYVALGEADAITESSGYVRDAVPNPGRRVRLLIWEYRALQTRIIFYDETGSGNQWRMTPSSASTFRTLLSRLMTHS